MMQSLNALAIVPGHFANRLAKAGQATLLDLVLPRDGQQVQMVWHRNTTSDPGCKWLRDIILELWQQVSPAPP